MLADVKPTSMRASWAVGLDDWSDPRAYHGRYETNKRRRGVPWGKDGFGDG